MFVYFNVCIMAFVVINAHWLHLLLSTWWKHYLLKISKDADWPSEGVQLDFLSWSDFSNLIESSSLSWKKGGSHHQSQVNSCCQSNVLSPVCINWWVSLAVMLLAVRLKWRRSVVIGRSRFVSGVRSFCSFLCNVNVVNESFVWCR